MPIRFRTILVTTDFSPLGDAAIPYALRLAKDHGARLLVATVVEVPPPPSPLYAHYYPSPTPAQREEARRSAAKGLTACLSSEDAAGVDVEKVILEGNPAGEIAALAKARDVSALVISTHGRSGLRHFLLGSVADSLLGATSCPVLLVR